MTVFEVVKASLVEVVPDVDPASVTAGRTLSDLGCTSIDRAEVVTLAMERLAVIAAITLPVTAIASIYGMNVIFTGRTHWVQLVIVLAVMLSISLWLLRWARRQGWW